MRKVRVAVADDHAIFLSGFMSLLKTIEGVEVVASAHNGQELVEKLKFVPVDVVFLDYRMPVLNGIETTRLIRMRSETIKILILSAYDDDDMISHALSNGANGYLTKGDRPEEIKLSIDSVLELGFYVNHRTSRTLMININSAGNGEKANATYRENEVRFTPSELMVIRLMAKEYSTREIAEIMLRSDRTIDAYRAGIMKKTGAKNLAGIVMYGIRYGIIELGHTA